MLTNILAAVFFLISMVFVYRSFYGMRIEVRKVAAHRGQALAGPLILPASFPTIQPRRTSNVQSCSAH